MDKLYGLLAASLEGAVRTSDQFTADQLQNYGRIFQWTPRFVVQPRSQADIVALVLFCREHKLQLTNRGAAHSQSQLAINRDGVLAEMQSMNRIGAVDESALTVAVEPGVLWGDLIHRLAKSGLVPPVLTNNLGVTVGGTLSMAGIGVASFRYGSQGDNVVELDVVTGDGKLVTCSPEKNDDLFWGAIAGLGSFRIITRARLQLRRMKPMTPTYYLL